MSTLILPEFHEYLESATFCAWVVIHKDNLPKDTRYLETSYRLVDGASPEQSEGELDSGYTTVRSIYGAYEGCDEDVHFHFDFERTASENESGETFVKTEPKAITEIPAGLEGKAASVKVSADFSIPLDELPTRGMIAMLLGVETKSCGHDMSLSGAQMAIDGGEGFSLLRWSYDAETDCVNAHICGTTATTISPDYLTDLSQLINNGLHCFILETPAEATNAPDTKPVQERLRSQKKA